MAELLLPHAARGQEQALWCNSLQEGTQLASWQAKKQLPCNSLAVPWQILVVSRVNVRLFLPCLIYNCLICLLALFYVSFYSIKEDWYLGGISLWILPDLSFLHMWGPSCF